MSENDTFDRVSRRTVLRTSALTSALSVVGGFSVGTVAGTGASQEGATFMEAFAGESPLVVARGDALGLDDEAIRRTNWLPDARIRGPEDFLAVVPRRIAEQNENELRAQHLLVVTPIGALEGDIRPAFAGTLFPGSQWYPRRLGAVMSRIGRPAYIAEEGLEASCAVAFRDAEWAPGHPWTPAKWFAEGYGGPEPTKVIDTREPIAAMTEAGVLLAAAAGHNFFPGLVYSTTWEELARAETATVLEPDDLRA